MNLLPQQRNKICVNHIRSTGNNKQMSAEYHSYFLLTRTGQNKGSGGLKGFYSLCVVSLTWLFYAFPVPARIAEGTKQKNPVTLHSWGQKISFRQAKRRRFYTSPPNVKVKGQHSF